MRKRIKKKKKIAWRLVYYAGQEMGLRCRCHLYNLSAVSCVYRYVILLKARLKLISPKLPKLALVPIKSTESF